MARMTASASSFSPLFRRTAVTSLSPNISFTPLPVLTFTPLDSSISSALATSSSSKAASNTWDSISTMVTSLPDLFSSSPTSTPMKPPPITTTFWQDFRLVRMPSRYSLSLGIVNTFSRYAPFSHLGTLGVEPSASTSFSKPISVPSAVLQTLFSWLIETTSSTLIFTPAFVKTASATRF